MNQLPIEIFNKIIILLPSEDKVEFMTVCKKWAHIIKGYCLFETIRISGVQQLNNIIKSLEDESLEVKQVERLIIDSGLYSNSDLIRFLNLFPNLRVVYMKESKSTQFRAMTTPSQNNRIESIIDVDGSAMASYFLRSNKCSHLKYLSVGPTDIITSTIPTNFGHFYLNLPMLDTLKITGIEVTFEELDTLHTLSPLLRSLELTYLQIKDTELPASIEPALSTTAISITLTSMDTPIKIKFFQYASKKYPKLLGWEYGAFPSRPNPDRVNQFYNEGVIPFIQPLASQLKRCILKLEEMPEDVKIILQKINHNQKWLGASMRGVDTPRNSRYVRTNRTKYFTSLEINLIQDIDFTFVKEFSVLKKLTLKTDRSSRQTQCCTLNNVLKWCSSTVEEISISCVDLGYDPKDIREYSNIRTLTLSHVKIDKGFDFFISKQLPNISRLELVDCSFQERRFCLPNISLSSLRIWRPQYFKCGVLLRISYLELLVCTQNDNQKRIWSFGGESVKVNLKPYFGNHDYSVYPQVKSEPYNESRFDPLITFELASVKNILVEVLKCWSYTIPRVVRL